MKKMIFLCFLFSFFIPLIHTYGADTDIYVLDQTIQQVPPDILFVLDLSGSMRWTPAGQKMYISSSQNCGSDVAYYPSSGAGHTKECTIDPYGIVPKWGDSSCSGPFYRSSRTVSGVDYKTDCSRVEIAKRAIKSILDANNDGTVTQSDQDTLSMRLGYMRFYDCGSDTGTNYNSGCNRLVSEINTPYDSIWNSISNAGASGGTHLAYSLKEAKLYLDTHKSSDNAKNCRKKFVVLISDGEDTLVCGGNGSESQSDQYKRRRETIAMAKALADAGYKVFVVGFGADLPQKLRNTLNWAAYYGGTDNQSISNSITGSYNIPSGQLYPSGITSCSNNTYDPGNQNISGYAYFAEDPSQLEQTLLDIKDYILNLLAESTSYVAPVVPISQMESTESMSRIYLAMFKPTLNSLWVGNIKKFGIAETSSGNIEVGDVVDVNGNLAITPQNEIDKNAKSYWSSVADGGEVVKGGVGEKLANRDLVNDPRKIYTYVGLPNKKTLSDAENAFTVNNSYITYQKLGISESDPDREAKRERIIKFIHGFDSYDWDLNGITDEKRKASYINDSGQTVQVEWILGAFIHSKPLIIHYGDKSVIYAGANDGMLHAFDDSDGRELWAFIPPSLLSKLKDFESNNTLQIFVDGTPKAYIERKRDGSIQKVYIIFGLRRGGDRYLALDVTNYNAPKLLWEIAPPTSSPLLGHEVTTGFDRLGQTWSAPLIKKVASGNGSKVVAFFAGGYDTCNDPNMSCGSTQKGNALYAIDIENGSLLWSFSNADMKFSIPSDITALDTNNDGNVDRLYVGDLGGQLWRFDIKNLDNIGEWQGKRIFRANQSSSEKRKIFYPPDVSFESDYEWVYFGTGDRENPKQETGTTSFPTQNRLYAIKDRNPSTPLTEGNLVDVTSDILQKPNPTPEDINLQRQTLNNLNTSSGWFITLENKGEKTTASPVIFGGIVYYTTFTPSYPTEGDICFLGEGTARVYALQYKTGNAAFNFDLENDTEERKIIYKSDRSMIIGAGIPSQVVIAVVKGNVVGYVGVGGGIFSPEMGSKKNIIPLYWRRVF
jgi:outer membrane protein assembly factor BamB